MKQMKYPITTYFAALVLLLSAMASCTRSELPQEEDESRSPLAVQVLDAGYTPAPGEPASTRATDTNYKTTFTASDRIGLYAVKNGAIITGYDNLCLTLTDDGNGNLSWSGAAYYEGTDAQYFAYYPYQSDMIGKVNAASMDANGFFDPLVRGWTPATDQSTHAKYTAQDLMIGRGTVLGSSSAPSLSLTLTHKMVLAVIKTPTTKYTLSTDTYYTWLASAPDLTFNGFAPWAMETGVYRYLVKPAASTQYSGSYSNAMGNMQEFLFSPNTTAGICATFTVDGGLSTEIEKSYTLQTGDFYMKDGSLVDKDATLTEDQKAACIGIVFWVGDITDEAPLLKTKFPNGTKGLAMALHDAGGNSLWSSDYEVITSKWLNKLNPNPYTITTLKESDKMQGYANTKALEGYNASSRVSGNSSLKVLPIDKITDYANTYPAPVNSSGWYWPSVKELKYMCWGQNATGQSTDGKDMLNKQLTKLGVASLQSNYYWPSTEGSSSWAWVVSFNDGYVRYYNDKNSYPFGVRAVVAF